MTVATVLASESRKLLIGESADPAMVAGIRALALADPAVEQAVDRLEQAIRETHPEVSRIFLEAESIAPGAAARGNQGAASDIKSRELETKRDDRS